MSKDEQIEGMNQLCRSYGFKELIYYDYSSFDIWELSIIEELYQTAKLYQLFQVCEGSPITIVSTISKPQRGMVKGTEYKTSIDNEWLKDSLFPNIKEDMYQVCLPFNKVLSKHGINIEELKPNDIDRIISIATRLKQVYKCTDNAKMGWLLHNLYNELCDAEYFPDKCSKFKKYSFLYDFCVLAGKVNNIEEGFSGNIGKEKYTQVRNWINAYNNQVLKKLAFIEDKE